MLSSRHRPTPIYPLPRPLLQQLRACAGMTLPKRALEDLVDIGVRQRLQRFGPIAVDRPALGCRTDAAVPADLLHVVIELDAMAVGVERERRIVDARIELGWDRVDKSNAVLLKEGDRRPQLGIAADFDAERHAGRALAEPQGPPQFLRKQPQAVVLGAAAQERAAGSAVDRLLAADKAEALAVERLGAVDVVDEQAHRTDLGDLERPRQ